VIVASVLGWFTAFALSASGQGASAVQNPVADLAARLQSGQTRLEFSGATGYLSSVLTELGINVDSQVLVFSKTSLDSPFVTPRTPRAIYFTDEASVALTPGAPEIEFTAADRRQGLVFYTLDVRRSEGPRLVQRSDCGGCHQGVTTPNVLSLVMMSVHTRPSGEPYDFLPVEYVDQRTPFRQRWGGWYVTGTHGAQAHRGNAFVTDPVQALRDDAPVVAGSQNITTLIDRVELDRYLAPTSDIVALLTFEHQAHVTNLMFAATRALRTAEAMPGSAADRLLDEAMGRLEAPVRGVSTFAATFAARGPRDGQGRSLRDFDLERRVFRYPLSFMIYSTFFDALPDRVRVAVYRRVYDRLTGAGEVSGYTASERAAAVEVLRATKPALPAFWMN
jgi:hypothetical protein